MELLNLMLQSMKSLMMTSDVALETDIGLYVTTMNYC